MTIPTEPIGSIPRTLELIKALKTHDGADPALDLLKEHEAEIRAYIAKGAHKVQVDFTEGRLAAKIDPSGGLLQSFIDLNNLALSRFSTEERQRLGVHTCPGSDRDSTRARVDGTALASSALGAG